MEKLNQLSLPVTILLASIILGGFYYASETRKSNLIEKQRKTKEMCYAEAEFDRRATSEPDDMKRGEFIDSYYGDCLRRFGQ